MYLLKYFESFEAEGYRQITQEEHLRQQFQMGFNLFDSDDIQQLRQFFQHVRGGHAYVTIYRDRYSRSGFRENSIMMDKYRHEANKYIHNIYTNKGFTHKVQIIKLNDDWFLVKYDSTEIDQLDTSLYWICDELSSVINLLETIKKDWQLELHSESVKYRGVKKIDKEERHRMQILLAGPTFTEQEITAIQDLIDMKQVTIRKYRWSNNDWYSTSFEESGSITYWYDNNRRLFDTIKLSDDYYIASYRDVLTDEGEEIYLCDEFESFIDLISFKKLPGLT